MWQQKFVVLNHFHPQTPFMFLAACSKIMNSIVCIVHLRIYLTIISDLNLAVVSFDDSLCFYIGLLWTCCLLSQHRIRVRVCFSFHFSFLPLILPSFSMHSELTNKRICHERVYNEIKHGLMIKPVRCTMCTMCTMYTLKSSVHLQMGIRCQLIYPR